MPPVQASPSPPVTLLCLPCAGASATMYLRWRRLLPPSVQVVPIELPGRGVRIAEPAVEDFGTLVARLCAENAPLLRGDFALFGHSMGALLACGMARRLQAQGLPLPRALLVSACAAPSQRGADRFAGPQDDDTALAADLRRQGGTPEAVFEHPELLRLTLDLLRADYRVCGSFGPRQAVPLPLPVHAFAGRLDAMGAPAVQAWSCETRDAFTLDWFDGGHFFIRSQEGAVLAALARRLGLVGAVAQDALQAPA